MSNATATRQGKRKRTTAYDIKFGYGVNHPDGKFFLRNNMTFAGDTMANFGVSSKPRLVRRITVVGYPEVEAYYLYRRKPVKNGLTGGFYFSADDFSFIGHEDTVQVIRR